ncbi:hypothetical protein CAOG_06001 [Capsaspora owczarzaki ATCC 30864]|uniref:Cytoplasmic tRNA 2-thiolation protein 2 n=1 Tax=Capsaspora owczarzaki (strain ATCC 30864) TaxID=595528 RepID=A0A0D2WUF5_CAPO3|nr:hypothetical protein CAOG_06001 [Capsaspora owczarzaki ATCC 30864]KJE95558.1 hypothetical protein CAOG_006001 [Capsaspora owczarzaki ATCC 30864]|eukprot:XP_004345591.1 hypothetical protein CAOG_06001 [Capsaspora owczarzaki ATCC 30864]
MCSVDEDEQIRAQQRLDQAHEAALAMADAAEPPPSTHGSDGQPRPNGASVSLAGAAAAGRGGASPARACVRCGQPSGVKTASQTFYCRSCFDIVMSKNTRLGVGQLQAPKGAGNKVLIACSGGPSSSLLAHTFIGLLHIDQATLSDDPKAAAASIERARSSKIFTTAGLVHIDESVLAHAFSLDAGSGKLSGDAERIAIAHAEREALSAAESTEATIRANLLTLAKRSDSPEWPLITARIEDVFGSGLVSGGGSVLLRVPPVNEVVLARETTEPSPAELIPSAASSSNRDKFLTMLAGVGSLSAREDLVRVLRLRLIVHIAKSRGYRYVAFGDSADRIAQNMISFVAQGRGASLAYDTSLLDARDPDAILGRPFRALALKDLALYARWSDVPSEEAPTLASGINLFRLWKSRYLLRVQQNDTTLPAIPDSVTPVPAWKLAFQQTAAASQSNQSSQQIAASISTLTEAFVNALQRDFTGTVSTVQRTSTKLVAVPPKDEERSCVICHGPIVRPVVFSSKPAPTLLTATASSEKPKEGGCGSGSGSNNSCACSTEPAASPIVPPSSSTSSCCSSSKSNANTVPTQAVLDATCYGCSVILRDVTSAGTLLPPMVAQEFARATSREHMRAEISEYLLSDDDDDGDD